MRKTIFPFFMCNRIAFFVILFFTLTRSVCYAQESRSDNDYLGSFMVRDFQLQDLPQARNESNHVVVENFPQQIEVSQKVKGISIEQLLIYAMLICIPLIAFFHQRNVSLSDRIRSLNKEILSEGNIPGRRESALIQISRFANRYKNSDRSLALVLFGITMLVSIWMIYKIEYFIANGSDDDLFLPNMGLIAIFLILILILRSVVLTLREILNSTSTLYEDINNAILYYSSLSIDMPDGFSVYVDELYEMRDEAINIMLNHLHGYHRFDTRVGSDANVVSIMWHSIKLVIYKPAKILLMLFLGVDDITVVKDMVGQRLAILQEVLIISKNDKKFDDETKHKMIRSVIARRRIPIKNSMYVKVLYVVHNCSMDNLIFDHRTSVAAGEPDNSHLKVPLYKRVKSVIFGGF